MDAIGISAIVTAAIMVLGMAGAMLSYWDKSRTRFIVIEEKIVQQGKEYLELKAMMFTMQKDLQSKIAREDYHRDIGDLKNKIDIIYKHLIDGH